MVTLGIYEERQAARMATVARGSHRKSISANGPVLPRVRYQVVNKLREVASLVKY
jgi:hypothetical protein